MASGNHPPRPHYGMSHRQLDIVNKQTMDEGHRERPRKWQCCQRDEDNVFTENNEFEKPVKVAQGGSSSHACTNAQLGTQRVELDNEINNLQGQVDVLDGRVGAMRTPSAIFGRRTPIKTRRSKRTRRRSTRCRARKRVVSGGS